MITQILLHKVATYNIPTTVSPSRINYIYGSNGTGKTTISRVIAKPGDHPDCNIDWKNNLQFKSYVYNQDFIKDNFHQSTALKGIFTLGKDTPEIEKSIQETNDRLKTSLDRLAGYQTVKNNKSEEIRQKRAVAIEATWTHKKTFETTFKQCLAGSVSSKEAFFEKLRSEQGNKSELLELDALIMRYNTAYNSDSTSISNISKPTYVHIKHLEDNKIFKTSIIGKSDSAISGLIKELNNSDWVHKGLSYLADDESACPFCQQPITRDLRDLIVNYFDSSYTENLNTLNRARNDYITSVSSLNASFKQIITNLVPEHSFDRLKSIITEIESHFRDNVKIIDSKIDSPSNIISLYSLLPLFEMASKEIDLANEVINIHNLIVANKKNEKIEITKLVWRRIANDTKLIFDNFNRDTLALANATDAINKKTQTEQQTIKTLSDRLTELESQITSITPTVNEINRILTSFKFTNFCLVEAEEKGHYKVIRPDRSDAKSTLSEGESNFIAFLYFYHLIKGSHESQGVTDNRIVVFDDPISSLDSNILFVVSNLIKSTIRHCKSGTGNIKQVFVLTHNIYFHKEVSFLGARDNPSKEESYWIVRKPLNTSSITVNEHNPISTAYELMWSEIRNQDAINSATIFNTMRRILEFYFKIIGSVSYEELVDGFDFEERQSAKALISWINDGSHFVYDDLFVDSELESTSRYLQVFKSIFDKLGHISHYNMMMRITT